MRYARSKFRTVAFGWLLAIVAGAAPSSFAQNVAQSENAKTAGVSAQWFISDASYASNAEIEGYASATSVNRGESISLYVKSVDSTHTIEIYRVGWYGGTGGRLIAGPISRNTNSQPACPVVDNATRLVECSWTNPYVLAIPNTADPTNWASGVYLAKLTAGRSRKQSYIIFVVRDDARPAGVMFQTAVTTYAAYNNYGGYNFYDVDSISRQPAAKVSFNRPYKLRQRHQFGKGAGDFLSWEINMLRFLEREGYDVTYSTNIDTHVAPARLQRHRMFLSAGHDEYYTKEMYDAAEGARNAKVNLDFFGANNIYWQIRLEPSVRGAQANRTVVGYKYATDPVKTSLATYLWRETSRAPINRPEARLIGVMYDYNSLDSDMIIADCSSWICAGTNLQRGDVLPGMLGYEVDRLDASSPAGTMAITSSPYFVCANANCSVSQRRFSHATYYQAASGAGVFATGSMQWNWGLDSFSPGPPRGLSDQHGDRSNAAVQQMTRNVLNQFTSASGRVPPHVTSNPPTEAAVGTTYRYDVVASDANGDVLAYELRAAPAGMSIDATTGSITWTPTVGQAGSVPVTLRVSDPTGLYTGQTFTIAVGTPNLAPEITSLPSANTIAVVGGAYSFTVGASDPNGDLLSYALTAAPAGMSINAATGAISWTPTADQLGAQAATVRVSDPGGLAATQSFSITVVATNVAPTITSSPEPNATVGAVYSTRITAEDSDPLSYRLMRAPAGMSIELTSGFVVWTPTSAQAGVQSVTVRVTDAGGLFAEQSFDIAVASASSAATNPTEPGGGDDSRAAAAASTGGGGGGGCVLARDGAPDALLALLVLLALFRVVGRRRNAHR